MNGFRKTIEDTELTEIDLHRGSFTWEKSKENANWVSESLDCAFASRSWWHLFPLCKLTVHPTICSDHDPIKLELYNVSITKKQFHFKFENTWLKEPNFHKEIKEYWEKLPSTYLLPKLISVSSFMAKLRRIFSINSETKLVNKMRF